MKKIFSKILISLLIVILISNYAISPVFADVTVDGIITTAIDILEDILGTIAGILTWPERLVVIWAGDIIQDLVAAIAFIDGASDASVDKGNITPFEILFNKVTILNVNVFDTSLTQTSGDGAISANFRQGIAMWFYAFRNIAVVILLIVLIYVGIRMAISTVASERARYQKMITDWAVSLALIFVMQYIAIFTLTVNDALVKGIQGIATIDMTDAVDDIRDNAYNILGGIKSIGAAFVFALLMWQTFGLFFTYFKRMLKICFLIVISPLVTLTYSIDKMGDGKAQAFNTWLKELVFGVLIQPFHCAIYMAFVSISLEMVTSKIASLNNFNEGLAACLVAILGIQFIKPAEQIVRKIFAFKDDSSLTNLAAGAAMAAFAFQSSGKIAKGAVGGIKFAKNLPQNLRNAKKAISTEGAAFLTALSAGSSGTGGTTEGSEEPQGNPDESQTEFQEGGKAELPKTFSERFIAAKKEQERKYDQKIADKLKEKKLGKPGDDHEDADKRYEEEINKETDAIVNASGGTVDRETAHQAARRKVFEKYARDGGVVRSAIGKNKVLRDVRKTAEGISKLETFKLGKQLAKGKIATGLGLFAASGAMASGQNLVTAGLTGLAASEATEMFFKEMDKGSAAQANKEQSLLEAFKYTENGGKNDNIESEIESKRYDSASSDASKRLDELADKLEDLLRKNGVDDSQSITRIRNRISSQDDMATPGSSYKTVASDVRRLAIQARKNGTGDKSDSANEIFDSKLADITNLIKQQYAGMALYGMVHGEGGRSIREIEKHALSGQDTVGASLERIYQSSQQEQAFAHAIQHIDEPGMAGRIEDAVAGVIRTDSADSPVEDTDTAVVDRREAEGTTSDEIEEVGQKIYETIDPHRMDRFMDELRASEIAYDMQIASLTQGQAYTGDTSITDGIIDDIREKQREIEAKNAEVLASYFRAKQGEVRAYDQEAFDYAQSYINETINRLNALIQQKEDAIRAAAGDATAVGVATADKADLEKRLRLATKFKNRDFSPDSTDEND